MKCKSLQRSKTLHILRRKHHEGILAHRVGRARFWRHYLENPNSGVFLCTPKHKKKETDTRTRGNVPIPDRDMLNERPQNYRQAGAAHAQGAPAGRVETPRGGGGVRPRTAAKCGVYAPRAPQARRRPIGRESGRERHAGTRTMAPPRG